MPLPQCWNFALGSLNRRSFLKMVGRAGLAATAVLPPAALLVAAQSRRAGAGGQLLTQPQEIRSANGVLRTTITAMPGQVQLGDVSFPGLLYNGAYLPPLLRPRLGDTMRISFRNALPDNRSDQPICGSTRSDNTSNLHFHGMAVSPKGNSDNVFVCVDPGREFEYEVHIPATGRQRPGLFWYHPHAHGVVAKQILGGMSGGLAVDGFESLFPFVEGLPERFFLIKHAEVLGDSEIISINGQLNPVVQIQPGEMQFWRIANIGATLFIKFQIEGMPLYVVAIDGHPRSRPDRMTEFSSSDRVSGSTRLQSVHKLANTPCARSRFKTRRGENPIRRSNWRRSSPTDPAWRDRMPKPRFWLSASRGRVGSMKCGQPP